MPLANCVCHTCQGTYKPHQISQKYCKPACRPNYKRKGGYVAQGNTVRCKNPQCLVEFTTKTPNARYCCAKCGDVARALDLLNAE